MMLGERAGLLFGCLRSQTPVMVDHLKALSDAEWTSLLRSADEMLVGPVLWHRLLSPPFGQALPDPLRATLGARRRQAAVATGSIHCAFRAVVAALHERGIAVIALKGLHLASLVYQDLGRRHMKDIDLLVPIQDVTAAADVMRTLGYAPVEPLRIRSGSVPVTCQHLPRFVKAGLPAVEIHWHLFNHTGTVGCDIGEVWRRAMPARTGGIDVQVLAPEDLLIHLCVHAAHDHMSEWTARPWCDIAATIDRYGPSLSWDVVMARATQWHARHCLYLALRFASDLLGAAVPPAVLASLTPAGFDERLLDLAMKQQHGIRLPTRLAAFGAQSRRVSKWRAAWNAVFLPRRVVADMYHLPRSSRLVYVMYGRRVCDLAKRRLSTLVRLHRDPALQAIAVDLTALQRFIAQE
jgi:hypothetical protein